MVRLAAESRAGGKHLAHHLLLGGGLEADVDEARAGDLDVLHPPLVGRAGQQRGAQLLGQRARVGLQGLGQRHGGGHGVVAVGGHFGRFEGGARARAGAEGLQLGGQAGEQVLFDGEHGARF